MMFAEVVGHDVRGSVTVEVGADGRDWRPSGADGERRADRGRERRGGADDVARDLTGRTTSPATEADSIGPPCIVRLPSACRVRASDPVDAVRLCAMGSPGPRQLDRLIVLRSRGDQGRSSGERSRGRPTSAHVILAGSHRRSGPRTRLAQESRRAARGRRVAPLAPGTRHIKAAQAEDPSDTLPGDAAPWAAPPAVARFTRLGQPRE
jgi:hypothetical protein